MKKSVKEITKNKKDFVWWGLRVSFGLLILIGVSLFFHILFLLSLLLLPLLFTFTFILAIISLKKENKTFPIIVLVGIAVILLILFLPIHRNPDYQPYYKEACDEQAAENNYQGRWTDKSQISIKKEVELCMNTGGCYFGGSACPPEKKLTSKIYFDTRVCTMQIVGQCVCHFDKEFDEEEGCV